MVTRFPLFSCVIVFGAFISIEHQNEGHRLGEICRNRLPTLRDAAADDRNRAFGNRRWGRLGTVRTGWLQGR